MNRIAIVDDNEAWCFALALRLQQLGYVVSSFTQPQNFLPQMDRFDVVLVDFSMPTPVYQGDMDGPEVISRVRQQLETPPILILISSFFAPDSLDQATELFPEADAVLSKQTESTELLAQIQQLLMRRI
ncbi:response regulator receiver protein [Leptolyngbya boryana NIES-2135]|jgi:CheY-like chemotaxis protein|uniref:Response regulator receiver protein n=1 Tax=Leptolyngbya boryana NIES-2135 TaxID=1973484 RepID=A0A1Z4JIV7_LEPBY|nr:MULTISPECIES: response regulator [Leptolyngbya]BAY56618.1 response regulator receiver protein [Leptolyngbya boryana NIES-2135]MBD2369544.1 response regulator [Leptolyngbya sp. FACHB-161]MBD2377349.1 response regulator [Leptolyngbya sp. FACHB-238]MBD2401758.1 response regulator [Leptolyngbya sp. FACHB-239]MBD2408225.1 response regulator [Leptolyngbya sp. FACHB-402]